jgi:uncharacterized protein YjbI with pentapeptide repeats
MVNSEPDLDSLVARVVQLEEQVELRKRNISWLKQYFDDLKAAFDNRPELSILASLSATVSQQALQIAFLEQQLANLVPSGNIVAEKAIASPVIPEFQENVTTADILETPDMEVQEEFSRTFTDTEFQIERLIWLVNRFYAAEEESQKMPVTVETFLQRYNQQERDFRGINLTGADLKGVLLIDVNFSGANLSNADLSNANLLRANLEGANLKSTNLTGTNLSEANLINCNLSSANLHGTQLIDSNLSKANLKEANLSHANLTAANLYGANLMGADLLNTNLTATDLRKTNLKNARNHSGHSNILALNTGNFNGAILTGLNLVCWRIRGDFRGADLSSVKLCAANLENSNFSYANLSNADLRGADLSRVNFANANLRGAQGVNLGDGGWPAELKNTIMPDGTIRE